MALGHPHTCSLCSPASLRPQLQVTARLVSACPTGSWSFLTGHTRGNLPDFHSQPHPCLPGSPWHLDWWQLVIGSSPCLCFLVFTNSPPAPLGGTQSPPPWALAVPRPTSPSWHPTGPPEGTPGLTPKANCKFSLSAKSNHFKSF